MENKLKKKIILGVIILSIAMFTLGGISTYFVIKIVDNTKSAFIQNDNNGPMGRDMRRMNDREMNPDFEENGEKKEFNNSTDKKHISNNKEEGSDNEN